MSSFIIPACFYPTTVLLVDDDALQNDLLSSQIQSVSPCKTFVNPIEAINFLNDYKANPLSESYAVVDESDDVNTGRIIKINFDGIAKKYFESGRHLEISIAVIDYHMPNMNGLELCKKIRKKHPNIKLVMLTAEADASVAIQAHNDKLIDFFIRKEKKDSIEKLLALIYEMQLSYFQDQSTLLFNSFINNPIGYPKALTDPVFAEFFFQMIKEQHIKEFYMINPFGDFLLVDRNNNISWMMIRTQDHLRLSYEIAEYAANEEMKDLAIKIKNGELAPFFKNEIISDIPPENWSPYLYPLEKIQGENLYYYAFIS
jgi:CheY-like chemotaxis protein